MKQRSMLVLALWATGFALSTSFAQEKVNESLEWQLPRTKAMLPFVQERPIVFVSPQNPGEWNRLTRYWNPMFETATDPVTGETVSRMGVKIKLPLGLSQAPKVPEENAMTVDRWELGRRLYFDPVLSSDGTVSCASCHDPRKGFTDQLPVSTGIYGNKGGVSAPTVMNAAFNFLQFWDGRATSLEDQCQKAGEVAKQINQGRELFFGKARCSLCHVGQNFSDSQFHNLGVGFKDGKLTADNMGRYARLPTGHKNPEAVGAFKAPTLRGLVSTAPYLHDGSEATLEQVIEFYDRGGNANEYLSSKMRDLEAEKAYLKSKQSHTPYTGPKVKLFGADQKPIVPFALKLTKDEKADLVMFLRSLEGEVDPIVMNPSTKIAATK